jgi:hypothetical protein
MTGRRPPRAAPSGRRPLRAAASALRRALTDPVVPVLPLAAAAILASAFLPILTWAVIGGLAGYTLSGSV